MKIDQTQPRVVMLPDFSKANPYQQLLAEALEKRGCRVELQSKIQSVDWIRRTFSPAPKILHIHWLEPLFSPPRSTGRWGSALRAVIFFARLCLLRALGWRIVWTVHNLASHENRFPKLLPIANKIMGRLSHAVIALSQISAKDLSRRRIAKESKIWITPHGNYLTAYPNQIKCPEARAELRLPSDALVFLSLGLLRDYKGALPLIQTFKKLPETSVRLVLAGFAPPDSAEKVRAEISDDDRILFFNGFVPGRQLQTYFNAADVVVLPYLKVLNSGSALLAMSFERPLIVPSLGSLPEIMDDSLAFFYSHEHPEGLHLALQRAIDSRSRLPAMGQAARLRAKSFDWDAIAAVTLNGYLGQR